MPVLIDAPASPHVERPARAPNHGNRGMRGVWGENKSRHASFAITEALHAAIEREAASRGICKSKLLYRVITAIEDFGVWDTLLNPDVEGS